MPALASRPEPVVSLKQGYSAGFRAGVYVHWPFCARKCPYCDFNSHVRASVDQDAWRVSLVTEIDTLKQLYPGLEISSIFFGGGTPSLMPVETADAILSQLDHNFGLAKGTEITLEANPSSVEADRFKGYYAAGVNRLSMGFQSLRDQSLEFLGRLHSAREALSALKIARSVFSSVSFDLIYALPDQSEEAWREELLEALSYAPDHVSLYQLTIEEGTAFWYKAKRGDLVIPDEDCAADLYELTDQLTRAAGLPRYEVSNHARPGRESQHNLGYWRGDFYAGIGPGAHGRLPGPSGSGAVATVQIKRPEDWLKAVAETRWGGSEVTYVNAEERAVEQMMMGLRLSEGLNLERVAHTLGEPIDTLLDRDRVNHLVSAGLLTWAGEHLVATDAGVLVLNQVVAEIRR